MPAKCGSSPRANVGMVLSVGHSAPGRPMSRAHFCSARPQSRSTRGSKIWRVHALFSRTSQRKPCRRRKQDELSGPETLSQTRHTGKAARIERRKSGVSHGAEMLRFMQGVVTQFFLLALQA